jgi:hypothetical protein
MQPTIKMRYGERVSHQCNISSTNRYVTDQMKSSLGSIAFNQIIAATTEPK